jgi:hypothetical protein
MLQNGLQELLNKSIIRSHGYIERVFKHIPTDSMPEKMNVPTFTSFLAAIARAAHLSKAPPEIFQKVLILLLTMGGIDIETESVSSLVPSGARKSHEHKICILLEKQDILATSKIARRKKNTLRYILLPQYRKVLESMLGTLASPLTRVRKPASLKK